MYQGTVIKVSLLISNGLFCHQVSSSAVNDRRLKFDLMGTHAKNSELFTSWVNQCVDYPYGGQRSVFLVSMFSAAVVNVTKLKFYRKNTDIK